MDLHWNSSPSSPKSSLYHVKLVLCSVIITKKKKKKKRKKSKVKKKIKSIILVNIFYQIWVPFHTHGNNNFIENRKEKKETQAIIYTTVCAWERVRTYFHHLPIQWLQQQNLWSKRWQLKQGEVEWRTSWILWINKPNFWRQKYTVSKMVWNRYIC